VAGLSDELDLHTFRADECADLVAEYVRASREQGLRHVRIVHGKGTGALRRLVHAVLSRSLDVARFQLADDGGGSWGATLVELAPPA
jgi:DNA-nicking Smr family endonuclease